MKTILASAALAFFSLSGLAYAEPFRFECAAFGTNDLQIAKLKFDVAPNESDAKMLVTYTTGAQVTNEMKHSRDRRAYTFVPVATTGQRLYVYIQPNDSENVDSFWAIIYSAPDLEQSTSITPIRVAQLECLRR